MKTINSTEEINVDTINTVLNNDFGRYPCWYADFDRQENKKQSKWKVGVKADDKSEDYSFALSAIKNYSEENWGRYTSLEFATTMLSLYRTKGKKAVKEWISDGCP